MKKKILVIEDNLETALVLCEYFQDHESDAEVAINGKEAIEKVKSSHYDFILMDLNMPEMDGIEATIKILENYTVGQIIPRIIALTAQVSNEDKERCLDAGMIDFIPKPLCAGELFGKLRNYVSRVYVAY